MQYVLKCLRKLNMNNLKFNTFDERFNQFFGNNILSLLDKSNHRFVCLCFFYKNVFLMTTKKYLIKNPLSSSFVFKS